MPSNILNSLVEYTSIRVDNKEQEVGLDSNELLAFPFAYLTGNKMARVSRKERDKR